MQSYLPNEGAFRMLVTIGVKHLLIHAGDLPQAQRNLPESLLAQPERYRHLFTQGTDYVFSLVIPDDPTLQLREVAPLPSDAHLIPSVTIRPESQLETGRLKFALDDNVETHWSTLRPQRAGQYFGLVLEQPRNIAALEFVNPWHEMFLPAAYTLYAKNGEGEWQAVAEETDLRLFQEQIHAPKAFRFRIVLPTPVTADRLRLVINKPLPGYDFVVHEVHLFERR